MYARIQFYNLKKNKRQLHNGGRQHHTSNKRIVYYKIVGVKEESPGVKNLFVELTEVRPVIFYFKPREIYKD